MPSTRIVISPPDAEEIKQEFMPVVLQARALNIFDKHMHGVAQECLIRVRAAKNAVHERLDPVVGAAHKAHKGMTTLRNDLIGPLDVADGIVTEKLDTYEAAQISEAYEASKDALVEVEPELADLVGISTRKKYSVEVMDIVLVCEHIVANPGLAHLVIPNTPGFNRLARAQQDAFRFPGCKLVEEIVRSVRT